MFTNKIKMTKRDNNLIDRNYDFFYIPTPVKNGDYDWRSPFSCVRGLGMFSSFVVDEEKSIRGWIGIILKNKIKKGELRKKLIEDKSRRWEEVVPLIRQIESRDIGDKAVLCGLLYGSFIGLKTSEIYENPIRNKKNHDSVQTLHPKFNGGKICISVATFSLRDNEVDYENEEQLQEEPQTKKENYYYLNSQMKRVERYYGNPKSTDASKLYTMKNNFRTKSKNMASHASWSKRSDVDKTRYFYHIIDFLNRNSFGMIQVEPEEKKGLKEMTEDIFGQSGQCRITREKAIAWVKNELLSEEITIIDCVKDSSGTSQSLCQMVKGILEDDYHTVCYLKDFPEKDDYVRMTLWFVHDKEYYKNGQDTYEDAFAFPVYQHFTWEKFVIDDERPNEEALRNAIPVILNELLLDSYYHAGRFPWISGMSWDMLQCDISINHNKNISYHKITISNGGMIFREPDDHLLSGLSDPKEAYQSKEKLFQILESEGYRYSPWSDTILTFWKKKKKKQFLLHRTDEVIIPNRKLYNIEEKASEHRKPSDIYEELQEFRRSCFWEEKFSEDIQKLEEVLMERVKLGDVEIPVKKTRYDSEGKAVLHPSKSSWRALINWQLDQLDNPDRMMFGMPVKGYSTREGKEATSKIFLDGEFGMHYYKETSDFDGLKHWHYSVGYGKNELSGSTIPFANHIYVLLPIEGSSDLTEKEMKEFCQRLLMTDHVRSGRSYTVRPFPVKVLRMEGERMRRKMEAGVRES